MGRAKKKCCTQRIQLRECRIVKAEKGISDQNHTSVLALFAQALNDTCEVGRNEGTSRAGS